MESYSNTMAALVRFLRHDDALRVTPADILRFKDHRLATINPRTGKTISAKTVKDSDLAGLKTIFGWAVANLRLPSNPALGLTIKLGKPPKLRSKGFTDSEGRAILSAASHHQRGPGERAWTFAAKRWVPWLCAYTGARVGEMAQLRKQDVTLEGEVEVRAPREGALRAACASAPAICRSQPEMKPNAAVGFAAQSRHSIAVCRRRHVPLLTAA
jgi:integrase